MPAFSRAEYERLLYALAERYSEVSGSTLRLYTHSAATAFVRGSVYFHTGIELRVFEYLDLVDGELFDYSYTVYRGEEKLRWYDPQPHPENPDLADTFPHRYHEPPDIKHNRRPAYGIRPQVPNLPILIAACIQLEKQV